MREYYSLFLTTSLFIAFLFLSLLLFPTTFFFYLPPTISKGQCRVTIIVFYFILFLHKEVIPFQHICKWPSDVFYNLVNYCFSRQDSRDPEHTWPEGTYCNNCFSCRIQRIRGEGREGCPRKWIGNTVFHFLKCQGLPFLLVLLLPSSKFLYKDSKVWLCWGSSLPFSVPLYSLLL